MAPIARPAHAHLAAPCVSPSILREHPAGVTAKLEAFCLRSAPAAIAHGVTGISAKLLFGLKRLLIQVSLGCATAWLLSLEHDGGYGIEWERIGTQLGAVHGKGILSRERFARRCGPTRLQSGPLAPLRSCLNRLIRFCSSSAPTACRQASSNRPVSDARVP